MQFQQQQLPSFATLTRKTLFPSYIGIALFLAKKISEQDTLFAISVWCENCKYKQPLYNSV